MKSIGLALLFSLAGCATSQPWMPLAATRPTPEVTLVWVGHGECERMEDGQWVRRPELDYDFSVEQRRMGDHWESVKSMRRLHPDYDGVAGDRAQTYFFALDVAHPDARVVRRHRQQGPRRGRELGHVEQDEHVCELRARERRRPGRRWAPAVRGPRYVGPRTARVESTSSLSRGSVKGRNDQLEYRLFPITKITWSRG
jgi:hypothetical protein